MNKRWIRKQSEASCWRLAEQRKDGSEACSTYIHPWKIFHLCLICTDWSFGRRTLINPIFSGRTGNALKYSCVSKTAKNIRAQGRREAGWCEKYIYSAFEAFRSWKATANCCFQKYYYYSNYRKGWNKRPCLVWVVFFSGTVEQWVNVRQTGCQHSTLINVYLSHDCYSLTFIPVRNLLLHKSISCFYLLSDPCNTRRASCNPDWIVHLKRYFLLPFQNHMHAYPVKRNDPIR